MAEVRAERGTAEIDGDFVVFLIGMRINRFWKPHKWLPVAAAMPRMLAELARTPDLGLLHARIHFGFRDIVVVQYWRSFAHLHRYATDRDLAHLPAWKAFNQAIAGNGDVGICMRLTWCTPAGTRASTTTCPRSGSAWPGGWCRRRDAGRRPGGGWGWVAMTISGRGEEPDCFVA
jgi:hypothetical protein